MKLIPRIQNFKLDLDEFTFQGIPYIGSGSLNEGLYGDVFTLFSFALVFTTKCVNFGNLLDRELFEIGVEGIHTIHIKRQKLVRSRKSIRPPLSLHKMAVWRH